MNICDIIFFEFVNVVKVLQETQQRSSSASHTAGTVLYSSPKHLCAMSTNVHCFCRESFYHVPPFTFASAHVLLVPRRHQQQLPNTFKSSHFHASLHTNQRSSGFGIGFCSNVTSQFGLSGFPLLNTIASYILNCDNPLYATLIC